MSLDLAARYAEYRATRFFESLDGLRGISILGVIWFHSWWGTPYYPILHSLPVLREGEFGVHIFYVLSGFLITTLLLRERERLGTISLGNFYMRRALRIWPLYYAVLFLYIFVVWKFEPDPTRQKNFYHYIPSFLTFTYTWFLTPRWPSGIFNLSSTLATEEQFYAFWPLILKFGKGFRAALVMGALLCLPVLAYQGRFSNWIPWDSFLNRVIINISIPIGLGALLAHALHYEKTFGMFYRLLSWRWMSLVGLLTLALSLAPEHLNLWFCWASTIVLLGASVVRKDHALAPILRFRPLAWVGVVSYGMYLLNSLSIHTVASALNRVHVQHPVVIFPLAAGFCVAVASASYHYFERPFLALKDRKFSSGSQPREAGARTPEAKLSQGTAD